MIKSGLLQAAMEDANDPTLETQQLIEEGLLDEQAERHIDAEQALDEMLHSSQESLEQLEALLVHCEQQDGHVSIESIEENFPELVESMEGISLNPADLLARYVQLTMSNLRAYGDAWAGVTKQRAEIVDSISNKFDMLQTKWTGKKKAPKTKDEVNLTYVSIFRMFSANHKVLLDLPFREIDHDVKIMEYVINKYGSAMGSDLKALESAIKGAKFDDDKAFEGSILRNIKAIGVPARKFEQKHVRTKPVMLGNRSLWVKHSAGDKLTEIFRGKLDPIAAMSKVIIPRLKDYRILDRTSGVFHDMACNRSDIDKLFRSAEELAQVGKDGVIVMNDNIAAIKKVTNALDGLKNDMKGSELSKRNIAQFKSITKYCKVLADCATQPMRDVTNHSIDVSRALFTLTSTAVSRM